MIVQLLIRRIESTNITRLRQSLFRREEFGYFRRINNFLDFL